MKVVLLQNIKKLGKKNEVKIVKNGFARNFLIPQKKAILATQAELDKLDQLKQKQKEEAEQELIRYQNLASELDGYELEMKTKVSDDGKLYGSINNSQISEKLNQNGFKISADQIKLKNPIKEIGEYETIIELPHNLECAIKVIITEKENKKQTE